MSKSTEASGTDKMFNRLYNKFHKKIYIKHFVSDDDSATRKLLPNIKGNRHLGISLLLNKHYSFDFFLLISIT